MTKQMLPLEPYFERGANVKAYSSGDDDQPCHACSCYVLCAEIVVKIPKLSDGMEYLMVRLCIPCLKSISRIPFRAVGE